MQTVLFMLLFHVEKVLVNVDENCISVIIQFHNELGKSKLACHVHSFNLKFHSATLCSTVKTLQTAIGLEQT